jgi:hypothetical protein
MATQLADSASQLADSHRRYADLQASSDLEIRALLARTPVNHPLQSGGIDTLGDTQALTIAMNTMNAFVQNPTLVAQVSLGAVVTVKRVNDACAALLKLLGTLRGALDYERLLRSSLEPSYSTLMVKLPGLCTGLLTGTLLLNAARLMRCPCHWCQCMSCTPDRDDRPRRAVVPLGRLPA